MRPRLLGGLALTFGVLACGCGYRSLSGPNGSGAEQVVVVVSAASTIEGPLPTWERAVVAPKQCVARGRLVHAKGVEVLDTAGRPLFSVDLAGTSVIATLGLDAAEPVPISVGGLLSFEARAAQLPLTVAREVVAREGVAELLPGADLKCARGKHGTAKCIVRTECAMASRRVGPITLQCDALTLDRPSRAAASKARFRGDGTKWVPRGGATVLELRREPRTALPVVKVRHERSGVCLAFQRLKYQGEWVQLGAQSKTVSLTGWVKRASMQRYRPRGSGWARGRGGCGYGRAKSQPHIYTGKATVARGRTVYFGSQRTPWATIETTHKFEVRHVRASHWVELVRVPGLSHCAGRLNAQTAFVSPDAVTFPAGY